MSKYDFGNQDLCGNVSLDQLVQESIDFIEQLPDTKGLAPVNEGCPNDLDFIRSKKGSMRIGVTYTVYESEDISAVDNSIERCLGSEGYELICSGYNMNTRVRDLQFERKL